LRYANPTYIAGQRGRGTEGFTLVEAVVALVVLGILAAAAVPLIQLGTQSYVTARDSLGTLGRLRYATERLARELREVAYNTAANQYCSAAASQYCITLPSGATPTPADPLRFFRMDGATQVAVAVTLNSDRVEMTYQIGANVLGPSTLTDRVQNFTVSFLQADGATAATGSANVAFVRLALTLADSSAAYPERTTVALRNH
jgi:MSHA biogenesis protein MshO